MKYSEIEEILKKSVRDDWTTMIILDGTRHIIYKNDIELRIIITKPQINNVSPLLEKLSNLNGSREALHAMLLYRLQPLYTTPLVLFTTSEHPEKKLFLPNDAKYSDIDSTRLEAPLLSKHIARIFSSHPAFSTLMKNVFLHTDEFPVPNSQASPST